nr:MAG TPA: putative tail component [Caudoviricetes sp.]
MSVTIQDHSAEVSAEIKAALLRGLEKCGLVAEGYAKKLCPVDTGNLRNSITHVVDEGGDAVYIGTNSEYGAYVIHKRNLAQESIIRVAGRILGYIKMQRDNFTLRMGNVPNHT